MEGENLTRNSTQYGQTHTAISAVDDGWEAEKEEEVFYLVEVEVLH